MKGSLFAGILAALVIVGTASASWTPTPWARKNMVAAVKAVGYPKPHARKVSCRGLGAPDTTGEFTGFRCVNTYRHHRHRRFQIAGRGEGGWLCAGKTVAGCKLLSRGFIPTAALAGEPDIAARGWVANKYGGYVLAHFCKPAGTSKWTCAFTVDTGDITVTITMKQAKGGKVVSATAS